MDPTGHFEARPEYVQAASAAAGAGGAAGAGTMLMWAGGAGVALGGGWLAGTWINEYAGPYIQNGLDAVFGAPGSGSTARTNTYGRPKLQNDKSKVDVERK